MFNSVLHKVYFIYVNKYIFRKEEVMMGNLR